MFKFIKPYFKKAVEFLKTRKGIIISCVSVATAVAITASVVNINYQNEQKSIAASRAATERLIASSKAASEAAVSEAAAKAASEAAVSEAAAKAASEAAVSEAAVKAASEAAASEAAAKAASEAAASEAAAKAASEAAASEAAAKSKSDSSSKSSSKSSSTSSKKQSNSVQSNNNDTQTSSKTPTVPTTPTSPSSSADSGFKRPGVEPHFAMETFIGTNNNNEFVEMEGNRDDYYISNAIISQVVSGDPKITRWTDSKVYAFATVSMSQAVVDASVTCRPTGEVKHYTFTIIF